MVRKKKRRERKKGGRGKEGKEGKGNEGREQNRKGTGKEEKGRGCKRTSLKTIFSSFPLASFSFPFRQLFLCLPSLSFPSLRFPSFSLSFTNSFLFLPLVPSHFISSDAHPFFLLAQVQRLHPVGVENLLRLPLLPRRMLETLRSPTMVKREAKRRGTRREEEEEENEAEETRRIFLYFFWNLSLALLPIAS